MANRKRPQSPGDRTANAELIEDPVEKLLLGAAPDEQLEVVAEGSQIIAEPLGARVVAGPAAARLASARAFLADHPDLHKALDREVERTWTKSEGERHRYFEALAERRAEIASRAQLEELATAVPIAETALAEALSTYLVEIEGRSAPAARA
jgi:hypothetical protein